MNIFTKKGDNGTSTLSSPDRIEKSDMRFEALGAFDELNSFLGLVKAVCRDSDKKAFISWIQEKIIQLSAGIYDSSNATYELSEQDIKALEDEILKVDFDFQKSGFILPGGSLESAYLDVSRCICRRAERALVTVSKSHRTSPLAMQFSNRLSDFLFAYARQVDADAKGEK